MSRLRNEQRENPLAESKRIEKFLNVENLIESLEDVFVFNNSMNINALNTIGACEVGNFADMITSY